MRDNISIMGYIYVIKNIVNNKIYVGQTTRNVEIRWREHRNNRNKLLSKEIKKYDISNFSFILTKEIPDNELDSEEAKLISEYNSLSPNGYNNEIEQSLTFEQSSKGGSNDEGHNKQSLKVKESYKNNPRLKDLGNVPRGISYKKSCKNGYELEGFSVRKKGIKRKEFMSSMKKNNLQYNLDRAINYLSNYHE
jgi:hypothetical protein